MRSLSYSEGYKNPVNEVNYLVKQPGQAKCPKCTLAKMVVETRKIIEQLSHKQSIITTLNGRQVNGPK